MHTSADPHLSRPTLRVLHLTVGFEPGGRRDAILTLARASTGADLVSSLAVLRGLPSDLEPWQADFEETRLLGFTGRPSLRQLFELRRWIRTRQYDILHTHDAASQYVASMLRFIGYAPQALMTFHRTSEADSAGWRNGFRNALTVPALSAVLTASTERRGFFLQSWLPRRPAVDVVPLGVDLGRFHPDPAAARAVRADLGLTGGRPLIAAVGHFGEVKGIDLAIAAVVAAAERLPDHSPHLVILGTGDPERVEFIRRLAAAAPPGLISVLGQRPDPERFLAAADLLLHTPRNEAFGLVLIQAMASGIPVVATRVGGIPDIVVDGEVGLLAPAEDPVAAADQVVRLIRDPALRHRLAAAALSRARSQYDAALFAERHRAVYSRILADRGVRRGSR
jgi:glycosyltransferase involved in cell wall biosynthesis